MLRRASGVIVAIAIGFAVGNLRAADWPQWLGAERDGVWRETGLAEKFPTGGPKVLWRTPIARLPT